MTLVTQRLRTSRKSENSVSRYWPKNLCQL